MRVVGFEPGEKGYERLPLHPARQHEEEEEDGSVDRHYDEHTTEQLDLDPELDDTGHTPSSACVTTEWACFDKIFKRGSSTSMVKTLMRIEVHAGAAAADGGGAPVALFHLEDEFVTRVHLPAVSARARYRLIVSLSYRGYVRLLSPAQAAAIGGRTQERCL